jgi:hypothetical protein
MDLTMHLYNAKGKSPLAGRTITYITVQIAKERSHSKDIKFNASGRY